MIKPPKLKTGAAIGVVSPSYQIDKAVFERTSTYYLEQGFKIIAGKSINLKKDLYAGTPHQRAEDMMDMFANPDIDAIICARGGYGANRVLPFLDFEVIKQNPKIFMGYSDITALFTSITQKTRLVTFHGPMLVTYKHGFIDYNFQYFLNTLWGKPNIKITPPKELPSRILINGSAIGPLWGGNLCLLVNRLGTSGELNTDGSILFIEDIGEQHYRFDRMMYHLREAGVFDNIKGLIIGELTEMLDTDPPFGKTTDEIVIDICGDLNIPIVTNFPCGHGKYQATLPISIPVQLEADGNSATLTILESTVS